MKRLLSLILAAVMIAVCLASCATAPSTSAINANIRVTSTDALDAASWLDSRLGDKLTEKVVIGTDASDYGVDVSALEDDGYIIRACGGEKVLFAGTPDGLDRAVRKYAKSVEAGTAIGDETYHEGYRIEELRLAGNDISEYAIRVESANDYVRGWVTDNVAPTLSALIGIACGFTPEVGGTAEHYIVMRLVDREGWKESSYNYHFEDGDLVIEFVEIFGAKNGALLFLENECGWTDLMIGMDVLEESDLVDVPADLDVTVHPTMTGGIYGTIRNPYSTLRKLNSYLANYSYKIPSAHHALGNEWVSDYGLKWNKHHPCLTDDEVFEVCVEEITAAVESKLAAGQKLGDDLCHIDLGMEDGNATPFCECKECMKVYAEEGFAWAGPVVRFANRVEEALDDAGYDGIKYSVFAYAGSNMPPKKTAPNDDVYITIVLHDSCDKHFIDGSRCTGNAAHKFMVDFNRSYTGGKRTIINNVDWSEWIKDWRALGTHLYVRVATLTNIMDPYMTMYVQYENMKFFAENEVMSIYNESYAFDGLDFNYIVAELYELLQYYPDMTREEYDAHYERLLEKYYGDGWGDIFALCDLIRKAEIGENCATAWGTGGIHYSAEYFAAHWDEMLALAESAARGARCALEERFCSFAKCIVLNMGCRSTYEVYGADCEEFAAACERWKEMIALLAKWGHPIIDAGSFVGYHIGATEGNAIFFTLEEAGAWPFTFRIEPTLEEECGFIPAD